MVVTDSSHVWVIRDGFPPYYSGVSGVEGEWAGRAEQDDESLSCAGEVKVRILEGRREIPIPALNVER